MTVPGVNAPGEEYYEQNYRNYTLQNPPRKMSFYRDLVAACCPGVPTPRVLELGCAFGLFLQGLDPQWQRFGLDINEYAVERATQAIPTGHFAVSSAEHIPFEPPFDVVASFDCLEHVPDIDAAGQAVYDTLAPGGSFVFVVPVYDGPLGWLVHRLDKDPTHVHKKSRHEWLEWAGRRFRVERWLGIYRYLLPTGYYVHWPTAMLRHTAPAVAIVASKR